MSSNSCADLDLQLSEQEELVMVRDDQGVHPPSFSLGSDRFAVG
jgi:hypothetical protein